MSNWIIPLPSRTIIEEQKMEQVFESWPDTDVERAMRELEETQPSLPAFDGVDMMPVEDGNRCTR